MLYTIIKQSHRYNAGIRENILYEYHISDESNLILNFSKIHQKSVNSINNDDDDDDGTTRISKK